MRSWESSNSSFIELPSKFFELLRDTAALDLTAVEIGQHRIEHIELLLHQLAAFEHGVIARADHFNVMGLEHARTTLRSGWDRAPTALTDALP